MKILPQEIRTGNRTGTEWYDMTKHVFFLFFILFFLESMKVAYSLSTSGFIQVPYSSNVPVIDGEWSTSTEWVDASETRLENENNQTAYLRIKHNAAYVFILIDFVTDYSRSTYDLGGACFDTLNDGGVLPQKDDYLFGILAGQAPKQADVYRGTSVGEKPMDAWIRDLLPGVMGEAGYSRTNDPYVEYDTYEDHRIYELQIPCRYFNKTSSYGFYAFVCDYHGNTFLEWPKGSGGIWERWRHDLYFVPPSPQNWGTINGDFVPEFQSFLIMPAFMTATLILVIIRRRKPIK